MKILFIFVLLFFFGCSNINNVTKNPPVINIIVPQDKHSLIFKHQFYNNYKTYDTNLAKFNVDINLSFNINDTLSDNGDDNLNIIKGIVDFKIFDKSKTRIIKTGSLSSSITTGSVSSLYSIDQNNNFAKERISKYLAYKLYQKILLNFSRSET